MDRNKVVELAIDKATKNGWDGDVLKRFDYGIVPYDSLYELLFNHDFAKALWGEKTDRLWACPACSYAIEWYKHNESQQYCPADGRKLKDITRADPYKWHPWQQHLQDMVIASDPLDYLARNL